MNAQGIDLHAQAKAVTALIRAGATMIGTELDVTDSVAIILSDIDGMAIRVYCDGSVGNVRAHGIPVSGLEWHRAHYPHWYESPENTGV